MRRRGNKSNKVPNVKLRPAERVVYSRPIVENCWAQDTQLDSDDAVLYDACPRPMKGIAICATGVPEKPTLFKQAMELGATCTPAFTDRVTHLVAVDHGGAKYTCALERKIPIVKPSWITENYQIWLKGDDVDIHKSVEQHRLPIFSGVVVCPSGITDITRRTQINKLVRQHDGAYLKELERPVRVTHLLCSGDEDTEKMRYAEKFNARGEAQIHLVWEEWFWDSLDFGGRFDEATYQVRRPRPERKTLAEARSSPLPPSSTVPSSQHDEEPSPSLAPKPKPNNAAPANADDAEEEQAFVNVLPDVMLQLWGGLLERRGYQITDGEVILSPSKASQAGSGAAGKKMALPPPESPERRQFGAARSVITSFRRANSFAPPKEPGTARQLPFRRTTSSSNAQAGPSNVGAAVGLGAKRREEGVGGPSGSGSGSSAARPQIFAGKHVRALGEAKGAVVRNVVEQRGGVMSTDEDEEVDFIIVRLVTGSKLYRMEEDEALRRKYRTDCWLEQCIYEDRICAPEEQVAFVPLGVEIPVQAAEDVVISISGFDQSESHGLKRLFRALGVTLAPTFTRRSTHLLCPSGTGLKFDKAREWKIPTIGMQWIKAVAATGAIPPVHGFVVPGSFLPPRVSDDGMEVMEVEVERRRDVKGKGKAVDRGEVEDAGGNAMDVEVDGQTNGITNTPPEHQPFQKQKTPPASPSEKPKTLERQSTIILPDPPESEHYTFGMPNHILGGSYIAHPSSLLTPTHSVIGAAVYTAGSFSESLVEVQKPARERELHQEGSFDFSASIALRQGRTAAELAATRVPSSKSPSPMKAPPGLVRTSSRASLSPVKIDAQATKALQESITTLLGKRPAPEGGEGAGGGAAEGTGAVGQGVGRGGKRARPQRKPQSRQPSHNKIGEQSGGSSTNNNTTNHKPKPNAGLPQAFKEAAFASSAYDDLTISGGSSSTRSQEESMRVMYEDPGQRDEKRRLMSLLKSQSGGEEEAGSKSGSISSRTRKSARVAGF